MGKNKLIILIKNPELGKAKTRIAQTTGDERALEIYKELLAYTMEVTSQVNCERYLYYSSFIDHKDNWNPQLFNKRLQSKGDLGDKIKHAFEAVIGEQDRTIIIGSDCGQITAEILSQGFKALEKNDVVIGPTFDGGYYLIGLNNKTLELFDGIPWSTEEVYPLTIEKVLSMNKSYFKLPQLNDIDFEQDYITWKKETT